MGLLSFNKDKSKEKFDQKREQSKKDLKMDEKKKELKKTALTKAPALDTKDSKEKDAVKCSMIIAPHVAEKASSLESKGVYVFKVKNSANKITISREIKKHFGVTPVRVNILNTSAKIKFVRRRKGVRAGFKKAMVFLKTGDTLNIK